MNTPDDALECGHSLADLSTYLDTGEIADPDHLKWCPECQAGLASLRRLSDLGSELLNSDVADAGSGSDDWMQSILDNLRLELRPGRNIPLRSGHPNDSLFETEGAITALIRSVADSLPGTAAGKCRLHGNITGGTDDAGTGSTGVSTGTEVEAAAGAEAETDAAAPGTGITVELEIAVVYGHPMAQRAAELRRELAKTLAFQTELNVEAIHITVTDVLAPSAPSTPETAAPETAAAGPEPTEIAAAGSGAPGPEAPAPSTREAPEPADTEPTSREDQP